MSSPIKDVLKTLNVHAELVEQALGGVIDGEGHASKNSIVALRQISALRAAGEDGYRLHQRLREYLQDHLQLFPAFQSLAEIGSRITQVNSLWIEIDNIRRSTEAHSVNRLIETIQTTVFDIADNMDRNMLFLQTLMQTRYGNVSTLAEKRSQNRYYQQQTNTLADDLVRLARVCDKVEREASERGMEDLARFLRRNLLSRVLPWQQGMSEMQTQLRREIFRIREIERDLKMLAQMDMLMRQQPSWRGFEVDLDADIPDFLLVATLPGFAPQVEPLDSDRQMVDEMERLVASLPPKEPERVEPGPAKRYTRVIDVPKDAQPSPAAKALLRLQSEARLSQQAISLVQWARDDEDASTMQTNLWLMFAIMGLRTSGLRVDPVLEVPREGERFTHLIRDALVHPKSTASPLKRHVSA